MILRKEAQAKIDKARQWANRMSPGVRQDVATAAIDSAQDLLDGLFPED